MIDNLYSKDALKLELIGRLGKLKKNLDLSYEHIDLIRNSPEASLRILAYLLKGIFLVFRKKYETLFKDLKCFIEIYINGRKKHVLEEKKIIETTKEDNGAIIGIFHSLLSDSGNQLSNIINESSKLFNGRRIIPDLKFKNDNSPDRKSLIQKIFEKSLGKNLVNKDSEKSNSICNSLEDAEKIDTNFIYTNTNNLFSNFINFNLDKYEKDEKIGNFDKNEKDENVDKNQPYADYLYDPENLQPDSKFSHTNIKLISKNFNKDKKINHNLCYDNYIYIKDTEKILNEKEIMKKFNVFFYYS